MFSRVVQWNEPKPRCRGLPGRRLPSGGTGGQSRDTHLSGSFAFDGLS